MSENGKTLYGKLAEVMQEIGRVEKRGHNDFHNYDYVTEADLVEAVREKLSSRNVALLPGAAEVHKHETLTTVHMSFVFVDGDSGETHEAEWFGTGDDKGDKGLYKAYTGALKYFLMKSFLIPTGDDPEGDTKTDKRAAAKSNGSGPRDSIPPSDKQLDLIERKLKDAGADTSEIPNMRGYCAENLTGGKEGSASKLIDKLMGQAAGQTALDLSKATQDWLGTQSDVPADTEGLPV